jgi:hypothetical protein
MTGSDIGELAHRHSLRHYPRHTSYTLPTGIESILSLQVHVPTDFGNTNSTTTTSNTTINNKTTRWVSFHASKSK